MSKRQIRIALCSGILLFALSFKSYGSFTPAPILNPKAYVSPSGEYTLKVDPSTRYGQDEGLHILTRGEKTIWSKTLPFTLWDAAVLDDGVVIGYAYSNGYQGFPSEKTRELGKHATRGGRLHIVIFEPNGDFRLNEHELRTDYFYGNDPARPVVRKMLVDVDHDRWLLIMQHDLEITTRPHEWRFFRISDGKKLGYCFPGQTVKQAALCNSVDQAGDPLHQNPASQEDCMDKLVWSMIDCRLLPGTPLVLVQWLIFTDDKESDDGVFALVSLQGEPVWCLNRPHDYSYKTDYNRLSVRDRIWEGTGILDIKPDGKFELWFPSDNALAEFEVKAQDSGWSVREIGRKEYDLEETEKTKKVEYPSIQLKHLGDIKLQAQLPAEEPIRDIRDFDFNDKGEIGLIRDVGCGDQEFVLTSASGNILTRIPLPSGEKENPIVLSTATWWRDNLWLLTSSVFTQTKKGSVWLLNSKSGSIEKIQELKNFDIQSLSSLGPDGYVILAQNANTFDERLIAFDSNGQQQWIIRKDCSNSAILFSPEDITVTSKGEVVVLENIRGLVQFIDSQGKYLRTLDLEKTFGIEPRYPTDIDSDGHGGIVIKDFPGKPPIWQVDTNGKVTNSFTPRLSDGKAFSIYAQVKVAPDGQLWIADENTLCRLTKDGVAEQVLGESPDPEILSEVAGFTVDHRGCFYVLSERTGCVHVFDVQGNLKHICKTIPTDLPSNIDDVEMTVDGEGNLYVSVYCSPVGSPSEYVQFSPDGTRNGIATLPDPQCAGRWIFKPGTQDRWIEGYNELHLVSQRDEIIRSLRKRPDDQWLGTSLDIGVAPDGSLAALGTTPLALGSCDPVISIFGPQGEPIHTIPLEYEGFILYIRYSGRYVFWPVKDGFMMLDTKDASLHSITLEGNTESYWQIMQLSPDASELWVFSPDTLTVHRYELPRVPDNPPPPEQS